jgi:hypothetical protein
MKFAIFVKKSTNWRHRILVIWQTSWHGSRIQWQGVCNTPLHGGMLCFLRTIIRLGNGARISINAKNGAFSLILPFLQNILRI